MTLSSKLALISVTLSTLLAGFTALAQQGMHPAAKPVPAVTEIDVEGLRTLLRRDSQRPLLINFWATWCDPCRDEFPDLVKIDADYRSKSLDLVAISLDDTKDIGTEVPNFLRLMKAEMPVYLLNAPDPEVAIKTVDAQWSGALPATFIFDRHGKIAYKRFGRITASEVRAAIDKVMSDK